MHSFNPSTWEADQADLCEFETSLVLEQPGLQEKLCLGKRKKGRKERRRKRRKGTTEQIAELFY